MRIRETDVVQSSGLVDGVTRRDALQAAVGFGLSLALPGLDARAAARRGAERAKSLILLWMAGGPSQLETWDPHPGTKIGGPTQSIRTKVPGLEIAGLYPQTAEQIDALSVIRSLVSKEGDHERGTYFLKTGYRPDPTVQHPSMSAVLAHQIPAQGLEIPSHVSLGGGQWPARGGYLGDRFDAFRVFDPGQGLRNMRPHVSDVRQRRRLKNLDVVTQSFRRGRRVQTENTLHQLTVEQALAMMTSDQLKAFELDEEPQSIRDAYGDHRFGRGCLVARRLVEQGVRAIEVTLPGWDTHANNFEGHAEQAKVLDSALARLLQDLRERDLLESTVVLCLGEFGRTREINPLDGRDHRPTGFSCLLGGGGLRSGVIVGATDPTGQKDEPIDPVEVKDLFATIFHAMGVDPEHEFITPIGRPLAISEGTPLAALL